MDWLTAGRPTPDLIGYLSRFVYKLILSIGLIQIIFILLVFLKLDKKKLQQIKNYYFEIILILFNLLIFLWIPAEVSYLQPSLVFFYLVISKLFSKKYILIIILINIITWFVNIDFLKIKYLYADLCSPTVAINAEIDLKIQKGYLFDFFESRSKIECFIKNFSHEYQEKVRNGSALSK
jgi:heme/copper-type cytochrome/quinol oxidase subunit 4